MRMVKEALTVTLKKAKCFNISSEGRPKKKKWEENNTDTFQSLHALIQGTVFSRSQDFMITSIRLLLLMSATISFRLP